MGAEETEDRSSASAGLPAGHRTTFHRRRAAPPGAGAPPRALIQALAPVPALALMLALALIAAGGGSRWGAASAVAQPAGRPQGASADEGQPGAIDSEQLRVDVQVRVVNGTTRQPGQAQTVVLQEVGPAHAIIAQARDVTGEVTLPNLFLDETRTYLVQVTADSIPYTARATGRDLAGGPITVYTFATTTDRSALAVSQLNLVVKRTESRLDLEYLITVANETEPQRTVLPDPTSFELLLPEAATSASFQVLSGAAPQDVAPVTGPQPERVALAVPLRSGTTRLRAVATLPYDGKQGKLRLGTSLPVRQLTLLAFPPDLRVEGGSFTDEGVAEDTGYRRWRGPSLSADQTLAWEVAGGAPPKVATGPRARPRLGVDQMRHVVSRARGLRPGVWVALGVILVGAAAIVLTRRRRPAASADAPPEGRRRHRSRQVP